MEVDENQIGINLIDVHVEAESGVRGMESENNIEVEGNHDHFVDEVNLRETNVQNVGCDNIVDEANLRNVNVSQVEVDAHAFDVQANIDIEGEHFVADLEIDAINENIEANLNFGDTHDEANPHGEEQIGINVDVERIEAEATKRKTLKLIQVKVMMMKQLM